jgi:uncharacterized membrane protein
VSPTVPPLWAVQYAARVLLTVRSSAEAPQISQRGVSGRRDASWAPYSLAFLLFAVYSAWSISRHERLRTGGYDLGIFEQAIRGYAHLSSPVATLKGPGFNLLGDHFHPILVVIAPFYRLFPSALTILIFQAALLAVSAIPITRLAMVNAGVAGGVGIGLAYGFSWGLQSVVSFDFHEVSFAVPMISFSLVAIVEKRWRSAALWAVPLILVKEDLAVTLAAIGMVIALRGQRRLGFALIGFAAAAGTAVVTLIVPYFNAGHVYAYTLDQLPSHQGPFKRLVTPATKWRTLLWLLLPTGFISVLSSIAIVAVPTLIWRFWSTNPLYWGMNFQYSAILVPIVFVASVEAVSKLDFFRRDIRRRWVAAFAAVACAIVCTFVFPWPLKGLFNSKNWHLNQAVKDTKSILEEIPSGSTVAADNHLAAQLTSRCTVYLFPGYPGNGLDPEWVVYSKPLDISMAGAVSIDAELGDIENRYVVIDSNASAVLMRRR